VVGKCISFDVAGIDTKDIVKDGDQRETPPKEEDNKDKEFENDILDNEKQGISPLSSHDWITTRYHLWKTFSTTSKSFKLQFDCKCIMKVFIY